MEDYALSYALNGFVPFPVNEDKEPVRGCMWLQWSRDKLLDQFKRDDVYGLALRCEGWEVVDIDNKLGNAYEIKQYIQDNIDFFDDLSILKTWSNGFHLRFRSDICQTGHKVAYIKDVYGEWQGVIETKGRNGYIVAPPSKGYIPIQLGLFDIPTITVKQRKQLLDVCASLNQKPVEKFVPLPDFKTDGYQVIELAQSCLRQAGWKFHGRHLTRPGKEHGTSATFGKVAPGVFYCFSPNAFPFDQNRGYTSFQVVMKLMFNNDYGKAKEYVKEKFG